MNKKIILSVVSSLTLAISSQTSSGQRIQVKDFAFGAEDIQSVSVALLQGQGVEGKYTGPQVSASIQIPYNAPFPEAVLSIYMRDGEEPIFSKLLNRIEHPPIITPYTKASAQTKTKAPTTQILPPPDENYPQWVQYEGKLADESLEAGLASGSYVAQIDFFTVTDGNPQGTNWNQWAYGQEGLWAKLIGSSLLNFQIEDQEVDIVAYVQSSITVTTTAVPARNARPATRQKLMSYAKVRTNSLISAVQTELKNIGSLRIDENAPWQTIEAGSDRSGLRKFIEHYGVISYDNKEKYLSATGAGTIFNSTQKFTYPEGTVTVSISSNSYGY